MAASPKYKVYRYGKYIASCKYAEDAAALVAGHAGAQIRAGHSGGSKGALWTEGAEYFSAGDSFDGVAELVAMRERRAEAASQP